MNPITLSTHLLVPTLCVGTHCRDALRLVSEFKEPLRPIATQSVASSAFPRKAWERVVKRSFLFLVSGFLFLTGSPAPACSVPVFRYALERWEPDPYAVVVFHRGPLSASEQQLVERLKQAARVPVNLEVTLLDVEETLSEDMRKLWQAESEPVVPWLVVRYPDSSKSDEKAWSGPLNEETARVLIDSPLRREVAKRILKGESAVWVLLESGHRDKDDAAARLLERHLKKLAETLQLPEAADDVAREILENHTGPELRIAFSLVRLSRGDPAEKIFADMLLHTESDLKTYAEPIAFPIFGRGRALDALVGKGITAKNIQDACVFITGACSCEVKKINPGRDLIMAVDWSKEIRPTPARAERTQAGPAQQKITTPVQAAVEAEDDAQFAEAGESSHALRNSLLGLIALIGATLFVMFRRHH